jgi:hypothetical protein
MYCHIVKLSSGLRRVDVGGPNVGLIFSLGIDGCRSGMFRIIIIAPRAARGTRTKGTVSSDSFGIPSRTIMECEMRILVYRRIKALGAVAGRVIQIRRVAIAHDIARYIIISICKTGKMMATTCSTRPIRENARREMVRTPNRRL